VHNFYWLGILPIRGNYGYLNGFTLQLDENAIRTYTHEGIR
jgi:hypothetical protein